MLFRRFDRLRRTEIERANDADAQSIPELSETRDNTAIWIKWLGPNSPRPYQQEQTIARLLSEFGVGDLGALDYDVRWRDSRHPGSWDLMKPAEAAFTIQRATDQVVVAAGFSMHRNGYIREVAVRALAATGDPHALKWLMLRCGDWVQQVSVAALEGVERFLNPTNASVLVEVLPLLDRGRFNRGSAVLGLRARVEALLCMPESSTALWMGIRSTDTLTRRAAVRLLVRQGSSVRLLQEVMATNDVVALALVARSIPAEGPQNLEAGRLLFSSSSARFRSQGLWRLTRNDDGPDSIAIVHRSLFDKAQSVRDVAQRWMARCDPESDVNDIYRNQIASEPAAALRGLGDLASEDDAAAALAHLDDDVPAVRLAALRLLARLGRACDRDLFVDRFLVGSAKERREAMSGLRLLGGADFVEGAWLAASRSGDSVMAKRVLFQLVPMADRWLGVSIALQAVANSDSEVADAGAEALCRVLTVWNRGYRTTQTVDTGVLREQFDAAQPALRSLSGQWSRRDLEAEVESLLSEVSDS